MTVPQPGTYIIPADLKRTRLPDDEWIVVRGMDTSVPRILLTYTALDGSDQETWMSLGDTVEMLGHRVLRFENVHFAGAAGRWTVTIREVLPDTPPYERPDTPGQTWHPAELRPFGTLDEAAITGFEQRIGTRLPRFYREWLAAHNGAAPAEDVTFGGLPFTLNEIHPLLGLRPDAPHLDLGFGESRRRPWFTDEYLVIAVPLGGLLAVRIRGVESDQIVFLGDSAMQYGHSYDPQQYSSPAEFLAARHAVVPLEQTINGFCFGLQPMPPVTPAQIAGFGPPQAAPPW